MLAFKINSNGFNKLVEYLCSGITFEAECSADDFVCMDKSQCISFNLTCDGVVNCTDASDESDAFCSKLL